MFIAAVMLVNKGVSYQLSQNSWSQIDALVGFDFDDDVHMSFDQQS